MLPISLIRDVGNKCVESALYSCTAATYDLKRWIKPNQAERKGSPEPTDRENPRLTEKNSGQRQTEDRFPSNPVVMLDNLWSNLESNSPN